ncbi:MAG: AraC family transcriptional regulator [Verrucomicrobiales bacterium]|jgi:AraC-like DNA-binding protein|nr:AraC family transcriptional regulator [Verrucomicrobiales bacterium]
MSKTPAPADSAGLKNYVFKIGRRCREWFLPLESTGAEGLRQRGVIIAGHSTLRPPYVMCRPRHKFHILLLPFTGELRLTTPGKRGKIRAGESWLVPFGSLCRYEVLRGTAGMTWFHFDANDKLPFTHGGAPLRLDWPREIIDRMRFYFETLIREEHHHDGALREKLYELIALELRRLTFDQRDAASAGAVSRIRRVWEELDQNLRHDWDVNAMARKANFSPSRFHALSVEYFGMTPHEKITRLRMNRARALLRLTNHKVETIAREMGYSTPFAFSKAFKKTTGASPQDYRRGTRNPGPPAASQ